MTRIPAIVMFFAAVLAPLHESAAVSPLSSSELAEHCAHFADDPDGADGIFCVRYIQGFIDGAVATDERVMRNVAAEYEKEESFSERAARTRLGRRVENRDSSYYAEFCLGAPVPLRAVVQSIVESLAAAELAAEPLARELVYRSLREDYPCEAQGQAQSTE